MKITEKVPIDDYNFYIYVPSILPLTIPENMNFNVSPYSLLIEVDVNLLVQDKCRHLDLSLSSVQFRALLALKGKSDLRRQYITVQKNKYNDTVHYGSK